MVRAAAHLIRALQVDSNDQVPHLFRHTQERFVPKETSVGDEDVDCAESVKSGLDDSISILSGADGRDSLDTDYRVSL
jgi:hypothetical protein